MEFKDYVRIVLAHWLGVVLLILVGLGGAVAYNLTQPKVYQASATGIVSLGKTSSTADASIGDSLAKSKVDVVRRDRDEHEDRRAGRQEHRLQRLRRARCWARSPSASRSTPP